MPPPQAATSGSKDSNVLRSPNNPPTFSTVSAVSADDDRRFAVRRKDTSLRSKLRTRVENIRERERERGEERKKERFGIPPSLESDHTILRLLGIDREGRAKSQRAQYIHIVRDRRMITVQRRIIVTGATATRSSRAWDHSVSHSGT